MARLPCEAMKMLCDETAEKTIKSEIVKRSIHGGRRWQGLSARPTKLCTRKKL